ncbi:MAG: hypothetical protein NTV97_08785 [Alphaproteobacteria bacterium]|nr:hypothetical protein [Alphaproteobacteria bacterium]
MRRLLLDHLNNPDSSWMCGRFGAVAEFHRDPGEPVDIVVEPTIAVATARGGMRLDVPSELRLVAYETLGKCTSWVQGVALCLPDELARMGGRAVVTELGPDSEAVRAQDRAALLFDLGLGGDYAEICVRSADPETVALLRAIEGQPLFVHGHALLQRLPRLSPHRVFRSRLGRVEVYQPIPPPDGVSPEGPHTHVLPRLLMAGLDHAATVPIPKGWVAAMTLYPTHPLHTSSGETTFDRASYAAFQSLLAQYGDPALLAGKAVAVAQGAEPKPATRAQRTGFRVGRRQLQWLQSPDRP